MKIHDYPKIYNIGHRMILDIFKDPVVIQEKIDGSQISFAVNEYGIPFARSKGAQLDLDNPNKLFAPAVSTIKELAKNNKLIYGYTYRGEALHKPKHNSIEYTRIPEGGIILFDVEHFEQNFAFPDFLTTYKDKLGLEIVPTFYNGVVEDLDMFRSLLAYDSILGGCKVEGVVVKNYHKIGPDGKTLMGKYVSEAFKEKHRKDWKEANPNRDDLIKQIIAMYHHPKRWDKAVQHLQEHGGLEGSPKDIGKLIYLVQEDVLSEEKLEIKDLLFDHFWEQIKRGIIRGLPEWYKDKLLNNAFSENNIDNS